jgi:hypothetical protein
MGPHSRHTAQEGDAFYRAKSLTQVKQFKGNATKYELSVCTFLTHWEYDERNKS